MNSAYLSIRLPKERLERWDQLTPAERKRLGVEFDKKARTLRKLGADYRRISEQIAAEYNFAIDPTRVISKKVLGKGKLGQWVRRARPSGHHCIDKKPSSFLGPYVLKAPKMMLRRLRP